MGFLSRLKKKTRKVLAGRVGTVMETISVGFVQPFKTIKAVVGEGTVKELRKEFMSKPLGEQLTGVALSTAGYIGAGKVLGAIKSGKAVALGKMLIPKTVKGKLLGAIATPMVVGSVIENPSASLGKITSAPTELAKFGGDIGKVMGDPSLENITELVKESPLISGAVALGGALALGKGIVPAVGQVATAKILTGGKVPSAIGGGVGKPIATPTTSPVLLPARQSVSTTPRKRRTYKRKVKKNTISQRVNINIGRNIKNKTVRYNNKR